MTPARVFSVLCLAVASLNGPAVSAQKPDLVRIVEKIDDTVLVPLKGNTLPIANAQTDIGRVRPDLRMDGLVLVLSRSPEQQAAFDAFVAGQYDSSSPDYHHWLQPVEVGEKFGPSLTDIATISSWLAGHGLLVTEVSKDRMTVRFSGTAAEVQAAFHTQIHNLHLKGSRHFANMSDPQIPAALAPVVAGVKALNDFHPRPLHRLGSKAKYNSSTETWQRTAESDVLAAPELPTAEPKGPRADFGITVSTQSGSYQVEDVSPYDFAAIYNVLPLWNSNIDGTGQTIAIVATSDINPADVASYRSLFGLPAGPAVQQIKGANGVDPGVCTGSSGNCTIGDLYENTLDTEVSGAVAKGAQIVVVSSGLSSPTDDPVYDSSSYIIQNNTAKVMSVSYGLCELFLGTSGNAAYNNLWETAATEGIAISVASGDSGSPACDQGWETSVPYGAQFGLSVSGLASTPYNTAVGGTDFEWCKPTIDSTGHTTGCSAVTPYWSTTNNPNTGASAATYIPEIPWNDSCSSTQGAAYLESLAKFLGFSAVNDPETACNFAVNNYASIRQQYGIDLSFFVDSVGGSGGASNCTSNGTTSSTTKPDPSSCSGGYTKPIWQAGVIGVPSDAKRDIPDVSFFAGNGLWASATLICVSEAGTCASSTNPTTEPTAQEIGGTSVAAPEMAGVMALINQKSGATQGNPNAELYALAARQTYSNCSAASVSTSSGCYFNDVNTSTNATPCTSGSLNCTIAHTGDTWGILAGFNATTGFDNATGLGSLNVANVVNNWSSVGGTATATITVTPNQNTTSIDQSLTVTVSVNGSNGMPTGNVGLVSTGYTGTAGALSAGSYSFIIPGYTLAAGNNTLTISYGGDSTYAEASATSSIAVTKLMPTVTITTSPTTVGANASVNVSVTVTGATGHIPSGTIQISGGGSSGSCTLASGACAVTLSSNTLSSGTDILTAAYGGDKDYVSAKGTANITVNTLRPTVTVTPLLTSLDTATTLQVKVAVSGAGATPTGTVSLGGLYNWGEVYPLSGGTYTFTVDPGKLLPGTDTLTVSYTGDGTYVPAIGTTTVTVSKATPTLSATPSATSIYTNDALNISGTLAVGGGSLTGILSVYSGGKTVGNGYLPNGASTNYVVTIYPGQLSPGTDTLTVTYSGDSFNNSVSTPIIVNVTQWVKVVPTVTVTPLSNNIDTGQSVTIAVAVAGPDGAPTGTVTLSGGGFTSPPFALYGGSTSFAILPNTFSAGTVTLTATYSGDPTYLSTTQTGSITVTQSIFALAATSPAPIYRGSQATSTITLSSSTNYSSLVSLTCAKTSGPTNQSGDDPTCTIPSGGYTIGQPATATVTTVAATHGDLVRPEFPGGERGVAAGGTVLALLFLCGIPARRRRWRSMLGVLVLLVISGTLLACGGGGGSPTSGTGSGGGGVSNPGTASGAYTFTVTGTGNDAAKTTTTTTFTLTIN